MQSNHSKRNRASWGVFAALWAALAAAAPTGTYASGTCVMRWRLPAVPLVRQFGTLIRARMEELRRERAQVLRSRLCRYRPSRDAGRGTE